MPEQVAHQRRLADLADTNPEALGAGVESNLRFKYIDLSSVNAGKVDWNAVPEVTLLTAPSRARRVLRHGDVLFGTVRPNLQSHGFVDWPSSGALIGSTGFSVIRARRGVSDSRYLYHCVMSSGICVQANRDAVGSSYPALNDSDVRKFSVFAPPFEEQVVIARALDTVDTAIRQTEAIIEKLKLVKQGLLHDLLTRGIDDSGELRPPQNEAPHLYKASALGWIPSSWEISPLLSKVDLPLGQVDPRLKPYRDRILVAPDYIESATGRLVARATASEQGAISEKYVCNLGDVIYSKIRPYLRKAVIAHESVLCSADMYPLAPHVDVNPKFLLAIILGERFSQFAESVSMRTGMPKVNREELAECILPWPPRDEQDAVVRALDSVDAKQKAGLVELEKLMNLKSGLMDDLLTGRVRVTPLLTAT